MKTHLRQGALSQREQVRYFLAMSLLSALAMVPSSTAGTYDWISWGLFVPVTALGVLYWYRCNGGDHGVRFLERATSISFVVTVRFVVLLVLPAGLLYFLALDLFSEIPLETTLADVAVITILEVLLLWRVGRHIQQVAYDSAT